jgi:uncharacterized protein (TIGR02231 family)
MWRRMVAVVVVCGVMAIFFAVRSGAPLSPRAEEPVPSKAVKDAPPPEKARAEAPVPLAGKVAKSRVVAVTVYPTGALVTREVEVPEGQGMAELTVTPLPPTTVQSSLYAEGTEGVRVLSTRFRIRPIREDTREDVRRLEDELKQLQWSQDKAETDIKAIQATQQYLTKLENYTAVTTTHSAEKGAVNSDNAIALSKYLIDTRLEKARELTTLQHEVQTIQEKTEFSRRKLAELTASPTRTEQDAVIVVDKGNGGATKVRLNYLVDEASWRPQYKLRAGKEIKEPVRLEYLAALSQHTGEDWANVNLVLSTAQPMLNSAPPDLHALNISVVARGAAPGMAHPQTGELEEQVKNLRSKAQKDFNERKASSGAGLYNTAAALDQSWELLNPEAAVKRACALATREGPSVAYHLSTNLTVPSRNEDQMIEVTRIEMKPDYYYKAVPVLTQHVYRLADLTNSSKYILLPGEATMYIGSDFVGQQNLPLVAIGEQFTAGFGVDPQLQVQRQMMNKDKSSQGGNQLLRFEYRILVSSYKQERVRVQVWDRLPHAETEAVGITVMKTTPEVSKDGLYLREQRPNNLLRWDIDLEPNTIGEKALAINYEFKLELEKQMTIGSFQSAANAQKDIPAMNPAAPNPPPMIMTSAEENKIKAAMARLTPEDRKLAETQVFCAIDQDSRLGSTGPILKEMCKGRPVFLCCKGCATEARANPDQAIVMLDKLMARVNAPSRGGK